MENAKHSHKIIIVGIGPGNPEYLLPKAREVISTAKVLVGGKRAIDEYAHAGQRLKLIKADIEGVLAFIADELIASDVVVMVSGDPGYYSLLDAIRKNFPIQKINVIPGISSLQLAFARLALPWHDATLVSYHGRTPKNSDIAFSPNKILGMLTDSRNNSQSIAENLINNAGWQENSTLYICERLSYADEKITATTLIAAANAEPVKNCVLIVVAF